MKLLKEFVGTTEVLGTERTARYGQNQIRDGGGGVSVVQALTIEGLSTEEAQAALAVLSRVDRTTADAALLEWRTSAVKVGTATLSAAVAAPSALASVPQANGVPAAPTPPTGTVAAVATAVEAESGRRRRRALQVQHVDAAGNPVAVPPAAAAAPPAQATVAPTPAAAPAADDLSDVEDDLDAGPVGGVEVDEVMVKAEKLSTVFRYLIEVKGLKTQESLTAFCNANKAKIPVLSKTANLGDIINKALAMVARAPATPAAATA